MAARHIRNTPVRFTAIALFQSSRRVSASLPVGSAARRTASSASTSLETSPWKKGTFSISCVGSPPSRTVSVTSISSSVAPSSANLCAMARPMPEEAPVISAVLPSSRFIVAEFASAPPHAGAAVDRQGDAGDEAGLVRGQEQRRVGDVPAGAHLLAQRHLGVALGL